ncbi:hypothetical protein O6H91_06G039100 [Diphasiastrum complanatum]|uniref:Uncharacterized protein n=1 Tax=Diphasiastrum complanatum TaxID=34168 RepID=A0ACC2DCR0_DIPCM|nr:hypothetical protein O6H91_06G039100 [Diphasiastrum complanatum]
MQNENNAKPICLDGHNHGMMGSSSSPTADGSSLDSSHSCLASLTKAAQGVSPVNSDQSSSLLKAHDYIGFSEVSSTSLTAQECVMDQGDEKPVLKKNLNLNLHETELRLGPPKPVKEEEDGFFFHSKQQFLTASIDNTGNKVLLRVQSENKLGNASFSEGIDQHDDTELGDSGLNLNIGLSSKSNRDASYSREEIGENKVLLKPLVDSQERFLQEVNVTDIKRQESMQNVIVQRQQLEGEDDKSSPDNTTMQQLQSINSSRQKQDSVLKEKEMPHELHNFGPRIISFTPVRGSSELAPANKFWQSQMMVAKLTDGARLSQNHALQSPRLSQPEQEMGFSRAMAGGKFVAATPKNAVTGAKRVFSEVVGDDAVVINGASKMPSSTVKTACDTESRAYNQHSKHHLSPSRFSWSSAAAQSPASWQIGVQDLERPAAFDPLPAPRQLLINGDIRDPSHQFGNKVLPKKPSLLHTAAPSESSHDVQDAKATLDDVETDTAPRAPVGWPPVQSFRKNSLPPPKPKMHVERRMETIAAAPFPSPKVYSQSDCLFVKVYMDGLSIGRKIDLKSYDSYEKLSLALEEMFRRFSGVQVGNKGLTLGDNEVTVKGRKINFFCGSEYVLTYEDKDGDLMLVGDVPWGMFMITVKRLRIMKGSEAIGLAPRSSDKVRCE